MFAVLYKMFIEPLQTSGLSAVSHDKEYSYIFKNNVKYLIKWEFQAEDPMLTCTVNCCAQTLTKCHGCVSGYDYNI